jgi:hypothetical protein
VRIEFSLTLDNFLEWQRSIRRYREREPNSVNEVSFAVAIVGLLLLALGYGILRWSSDCSAKVGGISLASGLLTTLAAIPLGIFLGRRRTQKAKEILRCYFERFYAGSRTFQADESGWRFTFGDAENVRKWSELVWVFSSDRILVMEDAFESYAVSTSSFSKEELARFKLLCEQALVPVDKLATASMFSGTREFIMAMSGHNWRKQRWKMLGLYVLGFFCVSFVGLVITDALVWSSVPVIAVLLCLLPISEVAVYKRQFDKQVPFQSADISNEFICFRSPGEIRKIKYRWISDIGETKRSLRLDISPNVFFLVPKVGFTQGQLSELRGFVRSGLVAPS